MLIDCFLSLLHVRCLSKDGEEDDSCIQAAPFGQIPIESGGFGDGGGFVSPLKRGILDEKGPTGVVTSARQ